METNKRRFCKSALIRLRLCKTTSSSVGMPPPGPGLRFLVGWFVVTSVLVVAWCPGVVSGAAGVRPQTDSRDGKINKALSSAEATKRRILPTQQDVDLNQIDDPTLERPTSLVTSQVRDTKSRVSFRRRRSSASQTVFNKANSPYLMTEEVVVARGEALTIEPGVTIQFGPGVGITVYGVLTAEGTPNERIFLTSSHPPTAPQPSLGARLVDGPTPVLGRLQLFHHGQWRSVCTNSRNWTAADLSVACRQLGFTGGQYHEWQDKANNDTRSFLLEAPACVGTEDTLQDCAWHSKAMGGGVCDLHPDLGVTCGEYHADWRGLGYWKGLDFRDAEYTQQLQHERTQYIKVSKSLLSYIDISYAGFGPRRELTAAVHAYRTPPLMNHFTVTESLYTGINFTMPGTYITLNAATVTHNRGYGIYVNSSNGGVLVEGKSVVAHNQADGIKYNFHRREPIKSADESFMDFCTGSYSPDQTYPLVMLAKQERNAFNPRTCKKTFTTYREDYVFTLHFNFMLNDADSSSHVEVRDRSEYGELLTMFNLRNHTYPPSVVSRSNKIFVKYTAEAKKLAIIYMEIVAAKNKISDLSLNETLVTKNSGHGVSVENLRSAVYVHKSQLTANNFGSGLNVRWGAGDVNVTYSTITDNVGDGVNVTYEGGLQNVSWSRISDNKLRGIALWFNESGENTKIRQETGVAYSEIGQNLDTGLLVGNFCREAFVNITGNRFLDGEQPALDVGSCWNKTENTRTVYVGNNVFQRNNRLAIKIVPAINMNLTIEWNEFYENRRGTVLIRNENLPEMVFLPLISRISDNVFKRNIGRYVMLLSLATPGLYQDLLVTHNIIQQNAVQEPYTTMTSRSHSAGVICLGSNNINIHRNLLENPDSLYEVSSHSFDQSTPINATHNWLGKKSETDIFNRILDRRDRYNLALIAFHPFLLSDNNMETPVISTDQLSEPSFFDPFNKRIIGGEVNGHVMLEEGIYTVRRDIYVHSTGLLTIPFGTVLEFEESIGVMVAGLIRSEGSKNSRVRFTLSGTTASEERKRKEESRIANELNGLVDESTDNELTVEELTERTLNMTDSAPDLKIKLVGGRDALEGRLMMYSRGEWGSVCSHGWTEATAAVACQQLGHVLNPEDWLLLPGELPQEGEDAPIVRGNIVCDEFDTDLAECRSDNENELENSCRHQDDVGLRCYPRSWAGIRLGVTAKESYIKGVVIEKAGLLDYSSRTFKPALQVDFHQHVLQDLEVRDNSHDGVGIILCNQYAISNSQARLFKNSAFYRNKRHGISFRQLGANISDSVLSDNGESGLHFNPFLSLREQREMTGWLKLISHEYTTVPGAPATISLDKDRPITLITKTMKNGASQEQTITFTTDQRNVIGIQILSPVETDSTEEIVIYDYREVTNNKDIARWDLRMDQVVFPTTTSSYTMTLHYKSGTLALGDVVIHLTAVDRRNMAQAADLRNFRSKWPMVFLQNTKIVKNYIGISTLHYNRYRTEKDDFQLRSSNETIQVLDCKINDNINQAVFVLSPYRVKHDNDDMAEFTFMINSTEIKNNGRGVEQRSWDVRESNNLFNWVFESVVMENNAGGVSLSLPYVWKFNDNFTHSVYVNQSSFSKNTGFGFTVDGHFARVNITFSTFEDNTCKQGVLAMRGMEKEMFIYDNKIKGNVGTFMVEFNMDSQSGILGDVFAYFEYNIVQKNRHNPIEGIGARTYQPASTAITVKGLQKVNITHNLLGDNEMDYELLAGLYTARIENYVNVEANWWGSPDASYIRERIFDFDDWNNYAIADFQPFLASNRLNADVKYEGTGQETQLVDFDALGGQLRRDLVLEYRPQPYVVKSDLTVMPGVTLDIKPGVIVEFYPSIGILVLGRLLAVGLRNNHIIFQPVDASGTLEYKVALSTPANNRYERSIEDEEIFDERLARESSYDQIMDERLARESRSIHSSRSFRSHIDIRLCVEGDCKNRKDGFLELYNSTTQQWVPVCDTRFTERNAQVVCHQLGHNKVHYFLGRNKRTEMYPNALVRVRAWPEPIQCQGTETTLTDCPIRMNGQIFDHRYECSWNGDFVYVSCGGRHLPNTDLEYWGGIRFSIPSFEHSRVYSRIHDPHTHHHGPYNSSAWPSLLEWVDVHGAGILHNEFSPAVLALHDAPRLRGVSITYSAHDGLSLISAVDPFEMLYNRFEHNLGYGVSLMGLTGETRESDESSFVPLQQLRLPYHVFGMVDICDSAKEMRLEERMLLYYKYDNKPVDCVKIFSSIYDVKNFGIRFLQFNLFNSTWDAGSILDRLILYDGDVYNETRTVLATLHANSSNHMKLFRTAGTRLSVQLHATGASGAFGFVAEILTLPVSNIGIGRNVLQNFTYNQYYNNEEGAMFCATAGEINPWLTLSWSRIEHNGVQLYGNFTTTRAALHFDLQNMLDIYVKNNLIRNNTGGLYINAGSIGAATKMQANITNNLFYETKHWPALYIESRPQSSYQHALIEYNDFSWSYSPYHDVITLAQIVSDFSYNYAHSNIGRHILDIYGFEKVRLPVYQTTSHNSLTRNQAVDPTYQGTIIAGSAGQQFVDNVFYNLDNAYEMVAVNESVRCNVSTECADDWTYQPDPYTSRSDVWKTPIDARNNWWGFNTTVAVSGRIHEKLDDITLLSVDYSRYKLDNFTLLFGCEPGYTLVGDACYLYVGAPVTYEEAKSFCRRDNASLPFLQKYYGEVQLWLRRQQPEYLWQTDSVWVQHYDVVSGCAAFVNRQVRTLDCDLNLPFICESDPDNTIDPFAWASDTLVLGAIAATIGCLILVVACVSCWVCKSRDRRKERLTRKNSIRASIRSNRSVLSTTSTSGFSDTSHRRGILENPGARVMPAQTRTNNGQRRGAEGGALPSRGEGTLNGALSASMDSIVKTNMDSSFIDDEPDYGGYNSQPRNYDMEMDNRYAHDPALENANINMMVQPTFDTTYQNDYFRDNSTLASMAPSTTGLTAAPSQQQMWEGASNHPQTDHTSSFGYSSFSPSTGPGHTNGMAPPESQARRPPHQHWSQSQASVYKGPRAQNDHSPVNYEVPGHCYEVIPLQVKTSNSRNVNGKTYEPVPTNSRTRRPCSTFGASSSIRNGSVGGGSTQNLPASAQPPATSYGESTINTGSVHSSGHSSTHHGDVTPPDELYNTATLPREGAPPRYPSHDLLIEADSGPGLGGLMMTAQSVQLPPHQEQYPTETDLANSRSRSSSEPLETSM